MTAPDPLADLRTQIDALDNQIIALLAQRYALLPQVAAIKAQHGISHRVPARVEAVINRNIATGQTLGLPAQMVREVYDAIIEAAHRFEATLLKD